MALTKPRLGQITTTVAAISDPITVLHSGSTVANVDVGFVVDRNNGVSSNVALYWNETGNTFVTAFTSNTGVVDSNIAVSGYANLTTGSHIVSGTANVGNLVAGGFFWSNGAPFISSTYSNTNVAAYLTTATISTTGNVTASNIYTNGLFWANGNVIQTGSTYTASTAPPASGNTVGSQWYNTTNDTLYEYASDGTNSYWIDITGPIISGSNTNIYSDSGNIYVSGNIIPTANVAYDLGGPNNSFKSLYLSGNTIVLGGHVIKSDPASGAIAFIPPATVAAPNPVATIFNPAGLVTTYATTGGAFNPTTAFQAAAAATSSIMPSLNVQGQATIGGITTITGATTINGLLTLNADIFTTGKLTITTGIFWANGTAYSSGSSVYGNTQVATYLPTYNGSLGGTLTNATQSGITTVGTLGSLTVTGNISSGNVSTTKLTATTVTASGTGTVANLITTNGVFWSNGVAYSSGSSYGNTQVAQYLAAGTTTYANIVTTSGVFWANGTAYSSGSGTTLPSQSGNSGKYLTTDGSSLSWGTVAGGGGGGGTTTNTLTIGDGLSTQDGDKLQTWLPPAAHIDHLGISVATNGTYTVVAASDDNGNGRGYVNVYLNSTGALQYKITISTAYSLGQTPSGVSISSNNLIAVGEIAYSSSLGRVHIFDMATWPAYSGTVVSITSATNTVTNPTAGSFNFGRSVAISSSRLVIGCDVTTVGGYTYAGAVYVCSTTGAIQYKITNPNSYGNMGGDQFGWCVALSGFTLVVGAYGQDSSTNGTDGTVYVFNMSSFPTYSGTTVNITSSNWSSYGFAINVPDPDSGYPAYMGYSVATNGSYVITGAINSRSISRLNETPRQSVGAVYVFNATNGSLAYKFTSPNPYTNSGQAFGCSVSVSGNNVLIGESMENNNNFPGNAYLFSLTDGKLKKTIYSPNAVGNYGDTTPKDMFGSTVAISGNYAVIGAPEEQAVGYPYQRAGAAYLFNMANTFDGSAATTVSLAPTSVIPGIYGETDGSTYVNVPHLQIDGFGRVTYATAQQFSVTQGIDHAFGAILVNGSEAFTASSVDGINFAAGDNVTLAHSVNGMGQKTITISSTGGGGAGGGGASSNPFVLAIGPAMINYSMGDGTFTAPATGKLLVQASSYSGDSVMAVGGPGLSPFSQIMGPYSGFFDPYAPGSTAYPWVSSSSVSSGATVHVIMSSPNNNTLNLFAWTLDSTTDPMMMSCVHGNGAGFSMSGSPIMMDNIPANMYSQYWSQPNYFYGIMYLMGGGDLSTFTPGSGVTAHYDSSVGIMGLKVPASVWASGGNLGSIPGYNGQFGYQGYFFGS